MRIFGVSTLKKFLVPKNLWKRSQTHYLLVGYVLSPFYSDIPKISNFARFTPYPYPAKGIGGRQGGFGGFPPDESIFQELFQPSIRFVDHFFVGYMIKVIHNSLIQLINILITKIEHLAGFSKSDFLLKIANSIFLKDCEIFICEE